MSAVEKHRTRINGLDCSYFFGGTGKPLVLLHGWGQSANMWNDILPLLSETYTCYALDLPGFGESSVPHDVWNVETYADFVHDFIEQLGLQSVTLVGHSFGGRVAYVYASKYPLDRLVLYSASDISRPTLFRTAARVFSTLLGAVAPTMLWNLHTRWFKPANYINPMLLSAQECGRMLDIYGATHAALIHPTPPVPCTTTLIYGVRDWIVPRKSAEHFKKVIPKASLVLVPRVGHFAHIQNPPAFIAALTDGTV